MASSTQSSTEREQSSDDRQGDTEKSRPIPSPRLLQDLEEPFVTGIILSPGPFPPTRQTPPVRLAKGEGLTPEQLAERGATPIFARVKTMR